MKKILFSLIIVLILSLSVISADTGTYEIEKQTSTLTIEQGNNNVVIDSYMRMKVTGGNIPWVTMGLPNSNYVIQSSSGAIKNIEPYNSYGWTGVRMDLDKTYYAGDSFEVRFQVIQNNFVNDYNGKASVQYTPTWWDNAIIDDLEINFIVLGNISNVTTSSEATSFSGDTITWKWNNVGRGERKTEAILMPKEYFPSLLNTPSSNADNSSDDGSTDSTWIFVIFCGIVMFFVSLGLVTKSFGGSYDSPSASIGGDREVKRHINMDCPVDGSRLDKRIIKGVTIDYCDLCGGCFYNKGEIEKLIKAGVDEKDLNKNNVTKFIDDSKNVGTCCSCDGSMSIKIKTLEDKETLKLYLCDDCDGIWLKRGVYQKIKDKRLEQEEENAKRVKDGDDHHVCSWWFFYPYIMSTGNSSQAAIAHYGGGSFGGGGSSSSSSSYSSCVSCACVSSCACACACAGGGAAGCAPKNKMKQIDIDKLFGKPKDLNSSLTIKD